MAISIAKSLNAASFDCTKAGTKVEKMICANPELSKLDKELAERYRESVAKDSSVKQEQLKWLKQRNLCDDVKCLLAQYKERVNDLDDFIIRFNRSLANNETSDKNLAAGMQEKKSNDALGLLFQQGGFWVSDETINRSNLSCGALLANNTMGLAFQKYEPNRKTILIRIGGRHPNQNNPEVQRMMNSDIQVPIRIENVSVSGSKVTYDLFQTNRRGAVMGETYELDTSTKVIRMLKFHTCQNCGEAELISFRRNQSGSPHLHYWCNG